MYGDVYGADRQVCLSLPPIITTAKLFGHFCANHNTPKFNPVELSQSRQLQDIIVTIL